MSEESLFYNYSSNQFEQVAIDRFRLLVNFLPLNCKIFREPWDSSTVLCLDFRACPYFLEITKERSDLLLNVVKDLGLAKSIIFRLGNQVKGWRSVKYSES